MFKRLVLGCSIVASLLAVPAVAAAHNPQADISCGGGIHILLENYNLNGTNTLKVYIDGTLQHTRTFGENFSVDYGAGSPYKSHSVVVSVNAWDDPTGEHGWTKDIPLSVGPCRTPNPKHFNPRASVVGPCGDPMYAFVFDNFRTNAGPVRFYGHYRDADTGEWVTVKRTLSAGEIAASSFRHVLGNSKIIVNARGHRLLTVRAAAPGNYRACKSIQLVY